MRALIAVILLGLFLFAIWALFCKSVLDEAKSGGEEPAEEPEKENPAQR